MPVIIHRNIPGEHILEGDTCWCEPMVVEDDDLRPNEVIHEISRMRDLKN